MCGGGGWTRISYFSQQEKKKKETTKELPSTWHFYVVVRVTPFPPLIQLGVVAGRVSSGIACRRKSIGRIGRRRTQPRSRLRDVAHIATGGGERETEGGKRVCVVLIEGGRERWVRRHTSLSPWAEWYRIISIPRSLVRPHFLVSKKLPPLQPCDKWFLNSARLRALKISL